MRRGRRNKEHQSSPHANEDSILEVRPISPAALDDTRCVRSKTPRQVLPEFLTYKIMSKVKPLF